MDALVSCLGNTLSSDSHVRQHAEASLEQRAYPIHDPLGEEGALLARVFASDHIPLPVRQAAGIALKQYIHERWSIHFDEFLRKAKESQAVGDGEAVPPEMKRPIRRTLLDALGDPQRKIRLLAAQLLSIIASCDFPDQFPELFLSLHSALQAYTMSDANALDRVHGAMKFLADFVHAEMDENQLLEVAQQFLPLLLEVLNDPSTAISCHTKARCVVVFRQCLISLYTVRDAYTEVVEQAVSHYLPPWLTAFQQLLGPEYLSDADWSHLSAWEQIGLRREIVRTLGIAVRFSKHFAPYATQLYSSCVENLERLVPLFMETEVSCDSSYDAPSPAEDDADVATDISGLASAVFTLFLETLETRFMRSLLVSGGTGGEGSATKMFTQLLRLLTIYGQITREDQELFEDDPSAFVDEDDEESVLVTLRTSTTDFLEQLLDLYPLPVLRTLPRLVQECAQASNGGWKWQEAVLMLLGNTHTLIEEILDSMQDHTHLLQPLQVIHTLAVPAMTQNRSSFLQGRSFVFLSQYIRALDPSFTNEVFQAAIQCLNTSEESTPLHTKLSAVRAIRNIAQLGEHLDKQDANAVIRELGPLLLQANGSPLVLVIDALEAALHTDFTHDDAPLLIEVGHAALQAWRMQAADHQVELSLAALLELLVKEGQPGAQPIVHYGIQCAADALNQDTQGTGLGASAAAMARAMLSAAPSSSLQEVVQLFLTAATRYLVQVDDSEAAQSLIVCLTILWQKCGENAMQWEDHGMSAMEIVLRIVQNHLDSQKEDIVGMPMGVLLVTLFLQANTNESAASTLTSVMPGLVFALASKLAKVTSTDSIMALLFPLQYLFAVHTQDVIALLSTSQLDGNQNALVLVVTKWLDSASLAISQCAKRVHLAGLCQLYTSWPMLLDPVLVQGKVRPVHADGRFTLTHTVIITRSKARSSDLYEEISARIKAANILLDEFQTSQDQNSYANDKLSAFNADSYDDDDDGWEDDEDANAADAQRDARRKVLMDLGWELGLGLDEDNEEYSDDPPYMSPLKALPAFQLILESDLAQCTALALRSTPEPIVAQLSDEHQAIYVQAMKYENGQ
ncbi:hypothetical protein MYAM1_002660 [Malassezia yamatoensis]|uniref:Importin N-terminal domain-containing protein n=1 Tax=Malassezia yamatoensis TaxID=253288 RepID=A0AAJ6CHI4_9BASI|nr:hypothetical protein MYAM1_002660 [Malassezia yamatoensis]